MGNIQIKPTRRRSTSIFGRKSARSRSPFQEAIRPNSPYYQDLSPIKYERSPRMHKTDQHKQDNKQSFFKSPRLISHDQILSERKEYRGREIERKEPEPIEYGNQNREKCEQIIRKVRNFNDFLLELKQRLEEDYNKAPDSTRKPRGQVSMSVKLENERVQLTKYKKLVERELSKTHSIQNISIQNSASGQKILTIQYEHLNQLNQKFQESLTANNTKNQNLNISADASANKTEHMATICHQSTITTKIDRIRQAQALWQVIKTKTLILNDLLDNLNDNNYGEGLTDYMRSKEQTVRMNQLLTSLEQANRQSIQTQHKIYALLG